MGENLRPRAGLDDVERAGRAGLSSLSLGARIVEHRHIEFAVGIKRTGIAFLDAELDLRHDVARVRIYAAEIAFLGDQIDRIAGQNGRAG